MMPGTVFGACKCLIPDLQKPTSYRHFLTSATATAISCFANWIFSRLLSLFFYQESVYGRLSKNPIWVPELPPSASEVTDWSSLPGDILKKDVFQYAIYGQEFDSFLAIGGVCRTWRAHLLDPSCLVSYPPFRHFLSHAFFSKRFDPIEVTAFFTRYLPEHQGAGLRLPLKFVCYGARLKNSMTPGQLTHILKRFPKVEMEEVTLRLNISDGVEKVASLLNICLEPKKHLEKLTIMPERESDLDESKFYDKILTKGEIIQRAGFFGGKWEETDFRFGYPAKVMQLLCLLKGRVLVLQIASNHAVGDQDLDHNRISQLFYPSSGAPALEVGTLDSHYDCMAFPSSSKENPKEKEA